jgi:hypothetical protein
VPWVKPKKKDVATAHVYAGFGGFRYSLRNAEGAVIYENSYGLRSRFDAREEIKKRFGLPPDKISMER